MHIKNTLVYLLFLPSPVLVIQTQPTMGTDLHMVLSMDTTDHLDVFRHYGYTLSMYNTQVSIFHEATQIIFSGLLQCLDCMHLEAQIVVFHMPVLSCRPGMQRATQVCRDWYSSGNSISYGEPLSPASTSGASSAPLYETLCMGPSPYCGSDMASLPTGCWECHLCNHLHQQLGGNNPGDLSSTSSPFSCASHLSISSFERGALPEGAPSGDPSSSPPLVLLSFSPSEMEQQPVRDCGRLFKVACGLFILMLMNSQFKIGAFIEKCQKSRAESCIFWRGRTGSLDRL